MKYIKNWFSNMTDMDTPYEHDGIKYTTVENYYQAMKTLNYQDRKFISFLSARDSKKYGRTVDLRDRWDELKNIAMFQVLRHKFKRDTSWGKKLIATKGDIVETNNWHDNYWGNCVCDKCANIKGLNHLGKMLTSIRDDGFMLSGDITQEWISIKTAQEKVVNYSDRKYRDLIKAGKIESKGGGRGSDYYIKKSSLDAYMKGDNDKGNTTEV